MQTLERPSAYEAAQDLPPALAEHNSHAQQSVFLGIPRRPGYHDPDEAKGTVRTIAPCRRGKFKIGVGSGPAMLNFNQLWAAALNAREEADLTHWAMCHDDVICPAGYVDTLIDEKRKHGAHIISAAVAIKDERGNTSTAIRNKRTGATRRLTMTELFQLPDTFDLQDCHAAGFTTGEPAEEILAINTGCWACRFTEDWVAPPVFEGFQQIDRIVLNAEGKATAMFLPEDWLFSEWVARFLKLKVVVTRKVPTIHTGFEDGKPKEYRTDHVWGTWKTDLGDAHRG